jgi:serine/threonine-protein kinase
MTDEEDEGPTDAMAMPLMDADGEGLLAIGTDVGGYAIERELGRGGMGIVYAATHPVIGKRAAIKVLNPAVSDNATTVSRFVQEARAVNSIGHPNIVDIFAFGALPDGRNYLAMDLLDGESLRARLKRGPLHVREAVEVVDEIASALIAAHDKGFIHRDLKPDNVFLVAVPGRVDIKLLDFGLAKLLPKAGPRAHRTVTGTILGTPDYMSPEQLRDSDAVDPRTDIYALGVMAFECLTGKKPQRFNDGTFDIGDPPSARLATVAMLPDVLADLVLAMMTDKPAGRPSLADVRVAIKRVRPSLPSLSVVGLDLSRAPEGSLSSLTASLVGASPVVAEPRAQPAVSPALRVSGTHSVTQVGVPPPPAQVSRPNMPTALPRPRESRTWLVIAALLTVVAGVVLAIVLAT